MEYFYLQMVLIMSVVKVLNSTVLMGLQKKKKALIKTEYSPNSRKTRKLNFQCARSKKFSYKNTELF
jgi:hypothetical protein